MPKTCIMPQQAEKLRAAFASGELSIENLYNMTSSQRVETLSKYTGESSKNITAKLERSFLMSNQKTAIKNWLFRNVAKTKPLYDGVTLDQAGKLSNLKVHELKKMTTEQRLTTFAQFVNSDTARHINERFEALKLSGNLPYWEERAFGTQELRENKKLKGSLAKLEMLNDMGVLNPKQLEKFMETFVEDKLGVNLTFEESQKLSELTQKTSDSFDLLIDSNNWTAENEEQVVGYFVNRRELEDYTESLKPKEPKSMANKMIDIFRANILGSPRSLINSALYQAVPGVERTLVKRLVSSGVTAGQLDGNFVANFLSELNKTKTSKVTRKFIKDQTKMAIKIYHKTGYDISRMETIEDGYKFFGEKVRRFTDTKYDTKLDRVVNKYGRKVNLGPKWFAGGTDTLFANLGRADTAMIKARQLAELELEHNELPDGMDVNKRANELLIESYSFNPKDPKAQAIREAGIFDAHLMNSTQTDSFADKVIKVRNALKIGKLNFGKALVPFAKISATIGAEGVRTATGYGIAKSIYNINKATKIENKQERITEIEKNVNKLIRYTSLTAAAIIFASFLDDDDYVGPYSTLSTKKYTLARAVGADPNSIRIGNKWVPLRYLPVINIPLSAMMTARQAKQSGTSFMGGYIRGMLAQTMELPGISEFYTLADRLNNAVGAKDDKKFFDTMKWTPGDALQYMKVRVVPSVISFDVWNALYRVDKYDFLGREVENKALNNLFKDHAGNEVIDEINRLTLGGNSPVISDPTGDYAKELEEKYGSKNYQTKLATLKKKYAEEVLKVIQSDNYKGKTDEQKKSQIDKLRTRYILNELKSANKAF